MILRLTLRHSLRANLPLLGVLLAFTMVAELIYEVFPIEHGAITLAGVSFLATAVVLFLSFRVGEAYERWWEARKLWGALVNDSRTFARQVSTFLTPARVPGLPEGAAEELIRRHIAYVHALRTALRFGRFEEADLAELAGYLPEGELEALRRAPNLPTWLNLRQAERLGALLGPDFAQQQLLVALDDTLRRLLDIQGGCERIKNTIFPASVTSHTRTFVWSLAAVIPLAVVNTEGVAPWLEVVSSVFTGFMFVKMEALGSELKNPFDDKPDDTPMTHLCRTIERDLLAHLGEKDLPPPIGPTRGVLM